MQEKTKLTTTKELLKYFPQVDLPLTLSDNTLNVFSKENPTIANHIVQSLFVEWEGEIDEFTEFVPCAMVDSTDEYHALIYWKGGLLKYECQ